MTQKETITLNEEAGTWDGGLWYSSGYKPYEPVSYVPHDPGDACPKGCWHRDAYGSGKGSEDSESWVNYRSSGSQFGTPPHSTLCNCTLCKVATTGTTNIPLLSDGEDPENFTNEWGTMRENVWYPSALARELERDYGDDWEGVTVGGSIIKKSPKPLWELPVNTGTDAGEWYHAGHLIIPLEQDRSEGYHKDAAMCDVCHTQGHFYVMGKSIHIDIGHKADLLGIVQDTRMVLKPTVETAPAIVIENVNLG